jgi:hypothetical protein
LRRRRSSRRGLRARRCQRLAGLRGLVGVVPFGHVEPRRRGVEPLATAIRLREVDLLPRDRCDDPTAFRVERIVLQQQVARRHCRDFVHRVGRQRTQFFERAPQLQDRILDLPLAEHRLGAADQLHRVDGALRGWVLRSCGCGGSGENEDLQRAEHGGFFGSAS